ncbi:MAG: hypothetical protein A4E57_01307 [Syntrophorhabdaceae bacterium PtaU1.Bin034]|nr:MAG: hypothetical protein A4E57_01307 [Syntrophorhabdaceae bacterium PtaU1.Bin034]
MRFICDIMFGKLAKYLRILGFDAVYEKNPAALEHYRLHEPDRIFLTRRRKTTGFPNTVHIESEITREQLKEIKGLIRSGIKKENVLNRCIECNRELVDVDKTEIERSVPEFVYHNYTCFKACPSCKKVYWEGSHTTGMEELIKEILT